MINNLNTIKNIFSTSGYENGLTEYIKGEISAFGDECYIDKIGNLIFHKKGEGDKLLINVPISSEGFFISAVTDSGKAKIKAIGDINAASCVVKRVKDIKGNLAGVILSQKDDVKDEDDLYIDFGPYKKDDVKYNIGDAFEIFDEAYELGENIYGVNVGRVVNILTHIDIIKKLDTSYDLYYAFTVMDNIGFKGAKTAAFSVNPDLCITTGLSFTDIDETEVSLNKGAVIRIKDSHIIVNKKLRDTLIKKLSDKEISYQLEVLSKEGLTNNEIMYLNNGILTANVNLPVFGSRLVINCVNFSDCESYKKSIQEIIK